MASLSTTDFTKIHRIYILISRFNPILSWVSLSVYLCVFNKVFMFLREHSECSFPRLLHEHLIIQLDNTLSLELLLQVLNLLVEPSPLIVPLARLSGEGFHLAKQIARLFFDVFEALLLTCYQTLMETLDGIMGSLKLGSCVQEEKLYFRLEL